MKNGYGEGGNWENDEGWWELVVEEWVTIWNGRTRESYSQSHTRAKIWRSWIEWAVYISEEEYLDWKTDHFRGPECQSLPNVFNKQQEALVSREEWAEGSKEVCV